MSTPLKTSEGFTLTELVVVIAVVAVLGLLLVPALAGTRPNSQAFQCLDNLRRLTQAWQMYAEDNGGKLARNLSLDNLSTDPNEPALAPGGSWYQWCPGGASFVFTLQATNFVKAGAIYPYVNSVTVYHCPADYYFVTIGTRTLPQLRSYSMNCYISPQLRWTDIGSQVHFYSKITDFLRPGPSMTYVLIEENERRINDGVFAAPLTEPVSMWTDIPSARHDKAGSLSYADGHADMKQWSDTNIIDFHYNALPGPGPVTADAVWLEQRASY